MKSSRVIVDGALTATLFIILLWACFYMPLVMVVGVYVLPLPFIYVTSKHGIGAGVVSAAVSFVLAWWFTNIAFAMIALLFIAIGCAMGYTLRFQKSAFAVLAAGSLVAVAGLVACYGFMVTVLKINPVTMFTDQLLAGLDKAAKMDPYVTKSELNVYRDQFKQLSTTLIPTVLTVIGVWLALVSEWVATPILRRMGAPYPKWLPLREWRFPRSLIWYYLVVMTILLFSGSEPTHALMTVCLNVYEILEIAMAVQGIAFIFFYCHMKGIGKAVPIVVTVIGVLFPFTLYLIRILGIIDLGFDLRSRMRNHKG